MYIVYNFILYETKQFEYINIYTYFIFLLNILLTNYILVLLLCLFIIPLNSMFVLNFILFVFMYNAVIKNKIKIIKNKTESTFNYNELVTTLLDGLIQVHPPLLYISIVLIFTIITNFYLPHLLKSFFYIILKLTPLLILFSIITGGY